MCALHDWGTSRAGEEEAWKPKEDPDSPSGRVADSSHIGAEELHGNSYGKRLSNVSNRSL